MSSVLFESGIVCFLSVFAVAISILTVAIASRRPLVVTERGPLGIALPCSNMINFFTLKYPYFVNCLTDILDSLRPGPKRCKTALLC